MMLETEQSMGLAQTRIEAQGVRGLAVGGLPGVRHEVPPGKGEMGASISWLPAHCRGCRSDCLERLQQL
jgi:hypothetical protein